ncbi:MAG: threonylcarbamoyl-AMP synthase [Wenzhouxiangella sp.]|nr:MAG: threonylcarbamoyl-AMP synthase [Wenzhouxiangella sp.]
MTSLLSVDPAAVFDSGRLIAMPTETVYGLAAPINRPDLVARIFELKGRPASNPLIVHVGSTEQARGCVREWPALAQHLAERFWPGPLTLVLPKANHISDVITAGQGTVALRMPDHPVALAILRVSPAPLVAPSANLFTRLSPTRAEDVSAVFDSADVEVVDGGPCRVGIESTIIGLDPATKTLRWLRPGLISQADIRAEMPADWRLELPPAGQEAAPDAPGQMREHYRPIKSLTVVVSERPASAIFASATGEEASWVVLPLPEDAAAAARQLYQALRQADQADGERIGLRLPPGCRDDPAWEGVLNRLAKAATDWRDECDPVS